jgi:predicted MPP superfamily phosphohydrolase
MQVVSQTNALQADLIFLTGDYVYDSPRYIAPAVAALADLKAKIGLVGVLGNHDWWDGGVPMKAAFARHGLPLIDNARVILTPGRSIERDASEGLCIAGVGDLWEDVPDYSAALAGLPATMPRLLLAHNPDAAEDARFLAGKHRVDLMISGHTHGGQVRVPGLGTPILPSHYGQKYASGLVQGPGCPVFISCGIGMSGLPIRFGVPPEIVLMELKRA